MYRLALILLVACGTKKPAAPPVKALAGDLVFTDVTVAPMDRDTTLAHQTVIVRGDKIAAIAPAASVTIDPGAKKIDGTGKWLMPGLADMHVHTWSEGDLTMFVAAGVTTVRNMFGSEQHLAWKKAIAEGKQFGPTLVTASPILDGDPPVWPGSIVLTKPDEVDGVVAGLKGKGYDFLKPYARLEKPVYDALVVAAKKHGMTLQGHVPKAVGLDAALAAGQRSIEHLDGWLEALSSAGEKQPGESYWKAMGRVVEKIDESKIAALVEKTKQAGTYNCATLIVLAQMARLDDIESIEKQAKWLSLIPSEVRTTWNPKNDFRLKTVDADDFKAMRTANLVRNKIARVLATSGAPMIVGTDTGNPYVIPGEGMHDEIELLVAAGAPRPRVMRAATADAAAFLGTPGTAGVVAVGARADLLLVGVDPLVKPLPLVPDGVVLRGTWLPKSELDAKLAALAKPAVVGDRFKDMPALAAEGKDPILAHYDLKKGDTVLGEERIAVGLVDGKRVVVAQAVMDVPGHIETTYRIAGQTTRVEQKTSFGAIALEAKPAGGKLTATGKDASGTAVELSEPLPADAFIAAPGIGGTIELADKLAGMKVGETRKATSLELATFPKPAIERATYEVTRKPDAGGNRVFSMTMKFGAMAITSDLVLDAKGLPLEQSFGSPLDFKLVRR